MLSSSDYNVYVKGHSVDVSVLPSLSTPENVHETAVCVADPGDELSANIVNSISARAVQDISL